MSPLLLGALSLCASCGRDRGPSVERCPCAAPHDAWQLVGPAPPGSMLDTRLGSIALGSLALVIALAIASANAFVVLCTLLIAPALSLLVFFGGRQWRTEGGALATTFVGMIVVAEGRGFDRTALPVAGYSALRGDWVAGSMDHGRGGKAWLGSDLAENALLATLLGAASRGSIVLWAEDGVRWTRSLRTRGIREREMNAATIVVEPTQAFPAEEDKLLHDLLAGTAALASDAGTYREPDTRGGRGETPLRVLLRGSGALGDPAELSRRYRGEEADTAAARGHAEAMRAEMSRAGVDLALRATVRALLHEIRHGVQSNVARALSQAR